jgi:hypothetical protein
LGALVLAGLCLSGPISAQNNSGGAEPPAGATEALVIGGGWQDFNWSGPAIPGTASPEFTFEGSACVSLTDAFCSGDQFTLYDDGSAVGSTDFPGDTACEPNIADPDEAFSNPRFSNGTFFLGEGSHTLLVSVVLNPFAPGSGAGYIRADECAPEMRATFEVRKDFTDGNPGTIEVTLSCNTGLPLEQTTDIAEGDGVEFVVTEFDEGELDCEIIEEGQAGYDASYFNGVTDSSTSCEYDALSSGHNVCTITNTPTPVIVTVNKEWVYGNTEGNEISDEFQIELECNAVIDGGYSIGGGWYRAHFESSGDDANDFTVHPTFGGNTCHANETVFDSAIESDNSDCQNLSIDIGQGAECTIVNTVFFEGIPTLNQYGLVLLALLMLGVGFVGFRRFA